MSLKLSTRDVALVAIFSALSVVSIKIIPGIPIVGVPDAAIKLDVVLAPIYGLIIGPYLGFLSALIGGFITAGSPFSILTSFSTAVSALVTGFFVRRKISVGSKKIDGWILAALVLGVLILGWYGTWVGSTAPLYPMLHIAGLLLILAFRGHVAKSFEQSLSEGEGWKFKPAYMLFGIIVIVSAFMFSKPYFEWGIIPLLSYPIYVVGGALILYGLFGEGGGRFAPSVCLATYCGIIADHMLGNLIFISVIGIFIPIEGVELWLESLGLPDIPSLFMYMIPVSTIERIIFTVIATLIGVGLTLALHRAGSLIRKA